MRQTLFPRLVGLGILFFSTLCPAPPPARNLDNLFGINNDPNLSAAVEAAIAPDGIGIIDSAKHGDSEAVQRSLEFARRVAKATKDGSTVKMDSLATLAETISALKNLTSEAAGKALREEAKTIWQASLLARGSEADFIHTLSRISSAARYEEKGLLPSIVIGNSFLWTDRFKKTPLELLVRASEEMHSGFGDFLNFFGPAIIAAETLQGFPSHPDVRRKAKLAIENAIHTAEAHTKIKSDLRAIYEPHVQSPGTIQQICDRLYRIFRRR